MKLFYAPGACSLGIHVLLEEIGKPYEAEAVNLRQPPTERALTALNRKSKVPTLVRDDGSVLTEYPAIAYWLAASNPEAKLFPTDLDAQARTLEAMEFCVATLHMQGFSPLFGARHAPPERAEAMTAQGKAVVDRGLARMSETLGEQEFLVGGFSIADSALFYSLNWTGVFGIEVPANLAAYHARLKQRPAIAAVLKAEGLS